MYSVIIPVYRNAGSISALIAALRDVSGTIGRDFGLPTEFVFVVDGSPDDCFSRLRDELATAPFASQLICHARNFGSFPAIRTGLGAARGSYFGVIAADLQEPPEMLIGLLAPLLRDEADIVAGTRTGREDPFAAKLSSNLFWKLYRRFVIPQIPEGGVDVFGCNRRVRDELMKLEEAHSSLIGQLFWIGFRRQFLPYERRRRMHGTSAWTFRKKLAYLADSIFAFTDLPIRIMTFAGALGIVASLALILAVGLLRVAGLIEVPGYTATMMVLSFFAAVNTLGLGIVGAYAWRAYENTKRRPIAIVSSHQDFCGEPGRKPEFELKLLCKSQP